MLVEGVDGVLEMYGLSSVVECRLLRGELLRIGGAVQTREVIRSVAENTGHSLSFVRPLGKAEEEAFVESEKHFRKAFFNALRRKRELEGVGLGNRLNVDVVVREPCAVAEAAA